MYRIVGMTDIAEKYYNVSPDFKIGDVDAWMIDDHHLIVRWFKPCEEEEWAKMFKDFDVWWITRTRADNKERSSMLTFDQMNKVDSVLYSFIMEMDILNETS